MRILVLAVSLLMAASGWSQSVPPRFELDYEAMANKIIERLDMKEGETFLAVAHPGHFDALKSLAALSLRILSLTSSEASSTASFTRVGSGYLNGIPLPNTSRSGPNRDKS